MSKIFLMKKGDLVTIKETGDIEEISEITSDGIILENGITYQKDELNFLLDVPKQKNKRIPKLLQISTPTCPPCQMVKNLVNDKYPEKIKKFYEYVDVTTDKEIFDKFTKEHNITGVPRFFLTNQDYEVRVDLGNSINKAIQFLDELQTLTTFFED